MTPGFISVLLIGLALRGYYAYQLHLPAISVWHWISLASGTAVLFFIYRIGATLFQPKKGELAALFCALSPYCVKMSFESKRFALLSLLSAAASYAWLRYLGPRELKWRILAVLLSIAVIYCSSWGWFWLIGMVFFMGWKLRKDYKGSGQVLLTQGTVLALSLPEFKRFLSTLEAVTISGASGFDAIRHKFFSFLHAFGYGPGLASYVRGVEWTLLESISLIALSALLLHGLWYTSQKNRDAFFLFTATVFPAFILVSVFDLALPDVRFFAFAVPVFYVFLSKSLLIIKNKVLFIPLLVLMIAFNLYQDFRLVRPAAAAPPVTLPQPYAR